MSQHQLDADTPVGADDRPSAGGNEDLEREVRRLSAELELVAGLLTQERAMFKAELESGAQELARRDEVIEVLRKRRKRLIVQRDRARAKVELYEGSRLVRFAARLVQRLRRLRGIA